MKFTSILLFFLVFFAYSTVGQDKINEEKFVSIGGIEQWLTIKGDNTENPVVLIIHGGPGSTMSHFKDDMFSSWMKEFTIVHWDQRGAGKTFGKNNGNEINTEFYANTPLNLTDMTNDGIAVTRYLLEYLDKKKVILLGTSWGTILATQMAQSNPELFHAYLGHAQFVNFKENIKNAYSQIAEMAEAMEDKKVVEKLIELGAPPYKSAKKYGQLFRIIKQYENENSTPEPSSWWKIAAAYDNNEDSRNRYNGDDYSFLNLVGDETIGVKSMVANLNFEKSGLVFRLPVFLVQGEQDILTSKALNKPYFEKIRAPRKEYHTVSNAAHGFNTAIINKQYEIAKSLSVQD